MIHNITGHFYSSPLHATSNTTQNQEHSNSKHQIYITSIYFSFFNQAIRIEHVWNLYELCYICLICIFLYNNELYKFLKRKTSLNPLEIGNLESKRPFQVLEIHGINAFQSSSMRIQQLQQLRHMLLRLVSTTNLQKQ